MVVQFSAGGDAIKAYLDLHASQGLQHVFELVAEDQNHILRLVGDLTEEEAMTVTPSMNGASSML